MRQLRCAATASKSSRSGDEDANDPTASAAMPPCWLPSNGGPVESLPLPQEPLQLEPLSHELLLPQGMHPWFGSEDVAVRGALRALTSCPIRSSAVLPSSCSSPGLTCQM